MKDLIISDLHLNPARQGGTTMSSRVALEDWLFEQLETTLTIDHDRLIIVGDLFDKRAVSEKTLLRAYEILKDEDVIILRGNHDQNSMEYGNICSLELLGTILPKCQLVFGFPHVEGDKYFIPHCFDQEEFDGYVDEIPDGIKWVFIHANFNNHFAVDADHSLNLSRKQVFELDKKGCNVFLGHEHRSLVVPCGETTISGNVFILGCHSPTSIADCLSGPKYARILENDNVDRQMVWSATKDYIELPHTDIKVTDHKFVRVNGECTILEYPAIVRQIAELRKKSEAFIVANNVKVKTSEEKSMTATEVTGFNVLELVLENLDDEFKEEVKGCL